MTPQQHRTKALLVFPRTGQDVYGINVGLPIGVLSLATVLQKEGFTPIILDERVENDFERVLRQALTPDVLFVGISTKTGFQIRGGLNAARIVREKSPYTPIVWGGVHPSLAPDSTIQHPLVDVICVGEGEITIIELARNIANHHSLDGTRGIIFKKNGSIFRTPAQEMIQDLDTLPRLNYDLLNMRDYITIGHILREPQLQLCTSRGCPHRCGYCYNLLFNHRQFRWMSAERTFEEIRHLHDRYGIRAIFFYDDYFFGRRDRIMTLLDLLEENDIKMQFEVSCRVDFLDRADTELLLRLKKNGFQELLIGIESGNEDILQLMTKDIDVDQVIQVNQKLASVGLNCKYSFMAGFPGETDEQILDTMDLMRRLLRENPFASATPLGIYTPYPGTELFDKCIDAGLTNFPSELEQWADYNWVEARHSYLSSKQIRFLNRLNVISRFFDKHAFQRFGNRLLRPLIMLFYWLYHFYCNLRLRFRFFAFMPEVPLINRFQQTYVDKLHSRLLHRRAEILKNRRNG